MGNSSFSLYIKGEVWYRLVSDRFDREAIRKGKNDVRAAFPYNCDQGQKNLFKPKKVLVATWNGVRVSFFYYYLRRYQINLEHLAS